MQRIFPLSALVKMLDINVAYIFIHHYEILSISIIANIYNFNQYIRHNFTYVYSTIAITICNYM